MFAPIDLRGGAESGSVTYRRLLEYGGKRLPQIYGGDSRTNIALSHLNTFVVAQGKSLTDNIGHDLGDQFENCLAVRLQDANEKYHPQIKHYLKKWARLNSELLENPHLSASFSEVLQLMMDRRGGCDEEVAKCLNVEPRTVKRWRLGVKSPKSKKCIQKLEGYLEIPNMTLTGRLAFDVQINVKMLEPFTHLLPTQCISGKQAVKKRRQICRQLPENFADLPLLEQEKLVCRAVVAQFESNPHRKRLSANTKTPYRFKFEDWPKILRIEWNDYKKHKTRLKLPAKEKRTKRWNSEDTANSTLAFLEAFYGFAIGDPLADDAQLRGLGLEKQELSLAILLLPDVFDEFLSFYFEVRGTGINSNYPNYLEILHSLTRESTGWLRQKGSIFQSRVPERYRDETESMTWDAICDHARAANQARKDDLKEMRAVDLQRRNPFLPILPILKHVKPLSLLEKMHQLILEELGWPHWINNPVLFQTCFLSQLLATFFLRESHWASATYLPNNTGNLYQNENGIYCLRFTVKSFKNDGSHQFDQLRSDEFAFDSPLPSDLQLEAEIFIMRVRPLLLGKDACNALFLHKGSEMSRFKVNEIITELTTHYISEFDSRGLQIEGVQPFGPHAYRDIGGTHVAKTTGIIDDVAALLMISVAIARKHYARFLPKDKLKRVQLRVFPERWS